MKNYFFIFTVFCLLSLQNSFAQSKQGGTAEDAKNILERTVNLVKANKTVAFAMITAGGQGGLSIKDVYSSCTDRNTGIHVAHPYVAGTNIKDFTSTDGKKLYSIMVKNAKEGVVSKISYKFAKPEGGALSNKEYSKTTFYTLVGGYLCGSGFYK